MTRCDGAQARRLRRQHTIIDQLRPRPVLLLVSSAIRGEHPSWFNGGCGRQADGTAVYPQLRKYPCVPALTLRANRRHLPRGLAS
jgi:hypothetical protein